MSPNRQIKSFYTDGACTGNPGPGGWGTVVYFTDGSVYEMGGAEAQSTNNRMELQAAIQALKVLRASGQTEPVTLYTDSEYVKNGITKWVKGWRKKGWKTAQGKAVLNQDLWETLDELNSPQVDWQYVRGHSGNEGNERCDTIARAFANGKSLALEQAFALGITQSIMDANNLPVTGVSDSNAAPELAYKTTPLSVSTPDVAMMDSPASSPAGAIDDLPREVRVAQLRNLVETLHIADEIASQGYLISSSELADLMDVNASAVTSRGDHWGWRNWIVSRVRREGNQILWQLERVDQVNATDVEG
ncbi:MAG: ribonuclease HI [Coleofasciculus sp. C3-bin4]|jgi:ribonuclease HI|nr:ribonuclease HI [Coleofasciculus sp. C3-bin4]